MLPSPGYYAHSYISSMVSPYHVWFCHMGYPELDVLGYPDGAWFIIQYYNSPVVPSLTKWQAVLGPLNHVEKTYDFMHKYAHTLDLTKRVFWDREEKKSQMSEDEWERVELHREEMVERASRAFLQNPHVMDRIARNGIAEMDLSRIARHVPMSEL